MVKGFARTAASGSSNAGAGPAECSMAGKGSRMALPLIGRILKTTVSEVRLPSIKVFGPQPVDHGKPFNTQPDGQPAIWMRVASPPPADTILVFGGTALPAAVEDRLVMAKVPAHLTAKPGTIPIWLKAESSDGIRVSDSVFFDSV